MSSNKDEKAQKSGAAGGEEALTFTQHLEELRVRLIKCVLAMLAGFLVGYSVSEHLLVFVSHPLVGTMPSGSSLTMINVTEGFMTHLKLALLAGIFISMPVWFFQAWRFVAPGLHSHERRYIWPFVFMATGFFLLGASFCYYLVLPWGLDFLLGFAGPGPGVEGGVAMDASLSIGAYLTFFTKMVVAFGLVFELPVVVFFLAKMGVITHRSLSKRRGVAVVIIFIIAAVLTPPDVFTQCAMAVPLWLLFEISIIVARIFGPKVVDEEEGDEDEEEDEDE